MTPSTPAIHESAHAVACLWLCPSAPFVVTIVPKGDWGGHLRAFHSEAEKMTAALGDARTDLTVAALYEAAAVVSLAGPFAERHLVGTAGSDYDFGAVDDLCLLAANDDPDVAARFQGRWIEAAWTLVLRSDFERAVLEVAEVLDEERTLGRHIVQRIVRGNTGLLREIGILT
jgi:hypothetical protein